MRGRGGILAKTNVTWVGRGEVWGLGWWNFEWTYFLNVPRLEYSHFNGQLLRGKPFPRKSKNRLNASLYKSVQGKLTTAKPQLFVTHSDFLLLQETNSRIVSWAGFKSSNWTAKDSLTPAHPYSTGWWRWEWLSSVFLHFWNWYLAHSICR